VRGDFLILRMDDVGAASKRNEVYSNWRLRIGSRPVFSGNWLFLKYFDPFRAWGRYPEMTPAQWDAFFSLLDSAGAQCTVAVTAAWVEDDGTLVPYPVKFPEAAERLKKAAECGLVEVANHGLTHCITKDALFRPRLFTSNRPYHREFTSMLPLEQHERHMARSQDILQQWLGMPVVSFVPPGNAFLPETVEFAALHGIRNISCQTDPRVEHGVRIIGNDATLPFHDREMVMHGTDWLRARLDEHAGCKCITVARYADMLFGGGNGADA
jgi:peptidoglycan/xylan/chitin deacetylase (PgdA/CDA1 family)